MCSIPSLVSLPVDELLLVIYEKRVTLYPIINLPKDQNADDYFEIFLLMSKRERVCHSSEVIPRTRNFISAALIGG